MDLFFIFLAFIGTIVISVSFVYSKLVLAQIENPIHMVFLQIAINYILLLIIYFPSLLLFGSEMNENLTISNIFIIFCSAMVIFAGLVTFFVGLKEGNVSTGGVIVSSRVIVSVFLAWLFLDEYFPFHSYLFILVVFIGVLIVSWQKELRLKDIFLFKSSGSGWFILAVFFFALGNAFIRLLSNQINILTQLVFRLSFLLIVTLLFYPLLNRKIGDQRSLKETVRKSKLVLQTIIYVILIMIADIATTLAIGESLTITEAIAALEGFFVFILMALIAQNKTLQKALQEPFDRKTLTVRFLGVIIATIGIISFIYSLL
ncbi:MAG: EamA family transporter [Candidatus Hodarchaeales archaeon]|jgi:drug/metabolite transporter (DMT)-like permease